MGSPPRSRRRIAPTLIVPGSQMRRLVRHSLVHNTAALYGVFLAGMLLPLLLIPYLARVLRPEGWGTVVFAQSFAAAVGLLLEYGFYLSATRQVARVRAFPGRVASLVAGVLGAKILLLGAVLVLATAASLIVPTFRANPLYLFWACGTAVAQGFSPFWYFQGVERMSAAAALEVIGKAAATLGVFLLVKQPEQGWLVLALQASAAAAVTAITTAWMYRAVPFRAPQLGEALAMLREGAGLFVLRGASSLYVQANSFILGLLTTAPVVAYFGSAEKLIRAALGLLQPATQALYPRISHLVLSDKEEAGQLLRLSLFLTGGLGVAMGVCTFLAAPWLVQVLLGPGYQAAVPVLRAFSALPPIVAVGTVLGMQWALPAGHDRAFFRYVLTAGVLNLGMAVLLAPRFGALGMAASVLLADAVVAGGLLVLAWRRGADVWRRPLRGRAATVSRGAPRTSEPPFASLQPPPEERTGSPVACRDRAGA